MRIYPKMTMTINKEQKEVPCVKCGRKFSMPKGFCGTILCEDCDPFMNQPKTTIQIPQEQITTIAVDEDKVSHVAEMLYEFMKQANSVKYWDCTRTGRRWVRGWARRIVGVL